MKLNLLNKPYDIPTSWADVTYLTYANCKTPDMPLQTKLSYQTTIPVEILSKLPLSVLKRLIELIEFQDSEPEFFEQYNSELSVGNEHYIKFEQSRKALESSPNQWIGVIQVAKIYTGEDISQLPVVKALGIAVFFLDRLKDSSSVTKPLDNMNRMKTR